MPAINDHRHLGLANLVRPDVRGQQDDGQRLSDPLPEIAGAIVRRQLESLHGLSPDEAKQQLKKLGHDAKISVGVVTDSGGGQTYIKACGQNKVCYTSGESGIGIHDDVTLYINPTLKIAAPPP